MLNGDDRFGFEIIYDDKHPLSQITQQFHFNKATGKKIILFTPADSKYPGDGAFILLNGVQNTIGFSRPSEYLGFNGKNCEAITDLGRAQSIGKVTVHALDQNSDWIWRPASVQVFTSADSINFILQGLTDSYIKSENANGTMAVNFNSTEVRYIKVIVSNWGIIPAGNSGADNLTWLFVDEIEVN